MTLPPTNPWRRALAIVLISAVAFAVLLLVAGVQPAALTPLVFALTGLAWVQVLVLGYAGSSGPRIGSLDERTFVGFLIAMFGTLACLLTTNSDAGRPWFPAEVASLLFRVSLLALLMVPTIWLLLWVTGRLGQRLEDAERAAVELLRSLGWTVTRP